MTNLFGAVPSDSTFIGASARALRTAGDLTLNSTTWADVDTGLDLVIAAVAGDWVEVGLSAATGTGLVAVGFDAVSLVSAAPVNNWSKDAAEGATEFGVQAWIAFSGVGSSQSGTVIKQIAAGDLSGGTVTIRLRYRSSAAVNKVLAASANQPLLFFAHNRRQP